ncbi:MAG: hypothetical protein ACYSWP_02430 [Planctomycetota bacterium]|jgi:hypothetical protein
MAKHRRGLHKEITSIFDGVPMPKGDDPKQPRRDSVPNQNDNQQVRPDPARERYNAPVVPKAAPTAPTQAVEAPKLSRKSQNQHVPQMPQGKPVEKAPVEAVVIEASGESNLLDQIREFAGRLFASGPGADSSQKKKMVILVPAVIVVLVIVYTRLFSGPTGTIPGQPMASTNTAALVSSEIDWQEPDLYPDSLRDPMRASVFRNTTPKTTTSNNNGQEPGTDENVPQLDLRFIMWSDNPSVMIGKEILHEGEEFDGIKILKINEHSIEFETDGKKYEQKDKK